MLRTSRWTEVLSRARSTKWCTRRKDPVLVGLGPAAVRDTASYLKYGGAETALGDEAKYIKRVIGFGVSQSGRFLRTFLYDGFNEDEKNRRAFDGVWAHVAGAGRGSFNARFAQPSRDGHPFLNVAYPTDLPPFTDNDGLLAKATQAKVVPKIFYSNGAYEYWGRAASLIHTTPDGKQDAPPGQGHAHLLFRGSPARRGIYSAAARWKRRTSRTPTTIALPCARYWWRWRPGSKTARSRRRRSIRRSAKDQLVNIGALAFPKVPDLKIAKNQARSVSAGFLGGTAQDRRRLIQRCCRK